MSVRKEEPITLHRDVRHCPECGNERIIKAEGREVYEANWLEEITFSCGYGVRRSTRDNLTTQDSDCRKSPAAARWKERRMAMADAIIATLAEKFGLNQERITTLLKSTLANDLDLYREDLEEADQ
jgi:hypothetical protein